MGHALKNKYSKTVTEERSDILSTSKRSPLKTETDRGSEWYISDFQNFLKSKTIHYYSRFTDKGPSIAERVVRTVRSLVKKPVFEKGNADWLSQLPSVIKQYNNKIHHSVKMTPVQASKTATIKIVHSNLQDRRVKQKPKINLGQIIRTADIKTVFPKGDSTN